MELKMENISKSFGSNEVLSGVSFEVKGGEITALLGENGAGKSTLMNILGGVIPRDQGTVTIDGEQVVFNTPAEAIDRGIAFIHQELNLINDLAVYENLFIGRELKTGKSGKLDKAEMIKRTSAVFQRIGMELSPEALVGGLDASYKQIVEISRALLMDAKLVIMDEPTTSLTEPEIQRVFTIMRRLRDNGVAIIFISHKLREVMEVCDTYTVLRDGHMVASGPISSTNTDEITFHMVGHHVISGKRTKAAEGGMEVIRAEKLSDGKHFNDVSFSVRKGEVVGFTGLLGDGRSELFQSIFGYRGAYGGKLLLNGKEEKFKSTGQAVSRKIAYVPRDRKENGIIKDLSILENGSMVTIPATKKGLFLDWAGIKSGFSKQKKDLSIKMGADEDLITSLSGGNQQKVVLARWLQAKPDVLILDNPTQGVDVGAKEEIYQIIGELAKNGVAVIVLSSEAPEIIRCCERCYVMYHGSIVAELKGDEMEENEIMKRATGV